MSLVQAIILGIVEGLTEFLPISSTAHLVLAGQWLNIPSSDFLKTFEISIQLGAILAVVVLYWKKIWSDRDLIKKVIVAFIPTAIIGLIFYRAVKDYLLDNDYIIAWALLIGGLILILFEKFRQSRKVPNAQAAPVTYKRSALVGLFQSLAIIPGVSRAAATIVGGLSLGMDKKEIVEFSFLLAIPTMAAATGLDLLKSAGAIAALSSHDLLVWGVGLAVSFLTAIIGIRFFLGFIQKRSFTTFGWYRIVLALVIFAWLFTK